MIHKKSFSPVFLALALGFATSILCLQRADAEEDGGISVGKLRFGKQTDDKWLTVDLRKTSRSGLTNRLSNRYDTSTGGPTVTTNSNSDAAVYRPKTTRPTYPTDYTSTYATVVVRPVLPVAYPPASTTVSNHKLVDAASIAVNNARGHSTGSCWRYVKSALLKAEAIDSYPKTGYAKQAATELVQDYGFVRTRIDNPFAAPIGSVLVYGGAGAGHVEIRTRTGFVSDFVSAKPSGRPLIGVFVK